MATIGNELPAERPDLIDPANITTAFDTFYEGDGVTHGVETHLRDLKSRVDTLESGQPASGSFLSNDFEVKNSAAPTYKVTLGLAELTATNVSLKVRAASGPSDWIVTEAAAQSMTNKTLAGNTNVIKVLDSNLRIHRTQDVDYLEFDVDAVTGSQYLGVRDLAGSGATDYIVFESLAQTVINKTFGGYKELVYTVTSNTPTIDASVYNNAVVTISNPATVTVSNLDSTFAHSLYVVLINSSGSSRAITWSLGGTTTKWSGGTQLTSVAANKTGIAAFTRIGTVIYATYLGEYS